MSLDLFQPLFDWIAQHPGWAGLFVFLIALTESLAIIGLFMPGVVLMFGIGTLIATGVMGFWPTFWLAVAGAIAGDGLSYWLGYHYKERLRGVWPFNRYPTLFKKGEAFFLKHGGKSILFGRFVGPVRPIVPLTAGMLGMGPWKFFSVNVLSALAWAPAYLIPGMLFGASLGLAAEVASRLAVLMVLLIALPWLGLWVLQKIYKKTVPHIHEWGEKMIHWGRQHKYLGQITSALVDPQQPEFKGLSIIAISLLLLAWLILALFQQFSISPAVARFDSSIYHFLQALRTPWSDHIMVTISQLGDSLIHAAIIATVLIWLLWQRYWLAAGHWLAMAAFALFSSSFLKQALALPRPNAMYEGVQAFSFPSTHTVFAVSTFGFIAILIARELPTRWRWLCYAVATFVIVSIAFSRLYLGAHWLSDVIGGLVLGLAWVTALGIAFRRHRSPPIPVKGLLAIPFVILLFVGGWHIGNTHEQQIVQYAPHYPSKDINRLAWLDHDWKTLPNHRVDTLGHSTQALNLQVAGPLHTLEAALLKQGWQKPKALNLLNAVQWLNPETSIKNQPLLPQVHNGRHAQLILVQPEQNLLLRLWPADYYLSTTNTPLWIGYVGKLELKSLGLFSVPHLQPSFNQAIQEFLPYIIHQEPKARKLEINEQGETLLLELP